MDSWESNYFRRIMYNACVQYAPEINVSRGLFYFPSSDAGEISVDGISVACTKAAAFMISLGGMILPDR